MTSSEKSPEHGGSEPSPYVLFLALLLATVIGATFLVLPLVIDF